MVVLEGGGGMLATGSNQYLQPDYLSPLPTTLDAKKSPLALLAQTCSQIGADSPPSKPLIPALEKPKKSSGGGSSSSGGSSAADSSPTPDKSASSSAAAAQDRPARSSPQEPRLAFKPYEANVLSKKSSDDRPPSSKSGSGDREDDKKPGSRAPSRKSASPATGSGTATTPAPAADSKSASERGKSVSPSAGTGGGASPIIRSGLEILHGHPKDVPLGTYKGPLSAGLGGALSGSLGALCSGCPPGLEPSNPAFRPPFAGGPFSHHHAAMLAASGYPGAPGPYVSYARVKTATGSEALVPVCKDPYCTGCQYSAAHQQMLLGAAAAVAAGCPSGCTQCDHQKYAGLSLSGLVPPGPVGPPPPLTYSQQLGRPYVCNWIAGDSYCGKRFASSDELLQHLRTHTSLGAAAAADSAAAAAAASAAASAAAAGSMSSLLGPHSFLSGGLHRAGYPNPPLSPLSAAAAAARYHPYSKPGLPPSLAASPFSAFNPTALGPYYSPYSLYGQRMGAAAVHP